MFYLIKTPGWLRKLYKQCIWNIDTTNNNIYLSFDDGPHPVATPFVLDQLKEHNAKATFFCIGKNVVAYPEIFRRIIDEGHAVGNHTHTHLNGWKEKDNVYLNDIATAKKYIDSSLFRPPYGRIKFFQLKQLSLPRFQLKTVMWTVLSGDFDVTLTHERCIQNVILNAGKGSIVVFHDSEKAWERLSGALPEVLRNLKSKGYLFEKITADVV